MRQLAWGLVALSLAACGGQPDEGAAPGASGGAGGGDTTGCTSAPNCGGCLGCFEKCLCATGAFDACVDSCATGAGGSGGSSGSAVGGSGGSGVGGGSGGNGGVGNLQVVEIETEEFVVQPGEEVIKCQNFRNPFPGVDVAVVKSESFMAAGSHHLHVFYHEAAQDGALEECVPFEFAPYIHGAAQPHVTTTYPEGTGRLVKATEGFRVSVHYLNTSGAPLTTTIKQLLYWVPTAEVKQYAGTLYMNQPYFYVPPYSPGTADGSCTLPWDVNLLFAVSHMHRQGVYFKATASSGEMLYEGTEWSEPVPNRFEPHLPLRAGTRIDYHCEYQNTGATALTFGESAAHNEMCILAGAFYPAPEGQSVLCLQGT